jgi:hypothetical protein
MAVQKSARKFGGRPVEQEPEAGQRTHLNAAVPLPLKKKMERAAAERGWSISSELVFRLQLTFALIDEPDQFQLFQLLSMAQQAMKPTGGYGLLAPPELQGKPKTKENDKILERWLTAARRGK